MFLEYAREENKNRRKLFLDFCKFAGGSFADGEEGSKGDRDGVKYRVNTGSTMKIIPSAQRTPLAAAPQDPNS